LYGGILLREIPVAYIVQIVPQQPGSGFLNTVALKTRTFGTCRHGSLLNFTTNTLHALEAKRLLSGGARYASTINNRRCYETADGRHLIYSSLQHSYSGENHYWAMR
jgi:hypothetical protein